MPASQISLSRRAGLTGDTPEKRWAPMVGEDVEVCVIEVDRDRRRLILSERAASSETRESVKERILSELTEGDERTGRVTSLADFGAFVNINGADGLVHLSEISWDRIQHPSEVLKVGQEVKVKIISVDREKKRIGLSLRQLQKDPWVNRIAQYEVGQLLEGIITRLTKFGAFARIEDDLEGLIHISEISERRIEHPKEVLKEGDTVTLRVIKIEPENHRIGLSIRRVDSMAYADMDWKTLEDILLDEVELDDAEDTTAEAQTEPQEETAVTKAEPEEEKPAAKATAKPKKTKAPKAEVKEEEPAAPQEEAAAEETVSEAAQEPEAVAEEPAEENASEAAQETEAVAEEPAEENASEAAQRLKQPLKIPEANRKKTILPKLNPSIYL